MDQPMYQSGVPMSTINIDGKPRHLRMTLKELRTIEERLTHLKGSEVLILDVLGPGRGGRWSMTELVVILTIMLQHEDPTLTEDAVAEHIHLRNLRLVTQAISEALMPTMPEPSEDVGDEREDPPLDASNGQPSGPRPVSILDLPVTSSGL